MAASRSIRDALAKPLLQTWTSQSWLRRLRRFLLLATSTVVFSHRLERIGSQPTAIFSDPIDLDRSPRRIGFLLVGLSPESEQALRFRQGMRDAGYSEGRNVIIEWRSAKGDYDRLPELVADLVRRKSK